MRDGVTQRDDTGLGGVQRGLRLGDLGLPGGEFLLGAAPSVSASSRAIRWSSLRVLV